MACKVLCEVAPVPAFLPGITYCSPASSCHTGPNCPPCRPSLQHPSQAPTSQRTHSLFPLHGLFSHKACSLTSFQVFFSNVTVSIRTFQMPYLKWQPLLLHTLLSFLIFLILYMYFTCLFLLFIVCLLSSPPPQQISPVMTSNFKGSVH